MAGKAGPGFPKAAAIAASAAASRGRRFSVPPNPIRSPFQRDGDRIVHATAFRRLKDKTQVFLTGEGDHYRTRLTHTLEVSRIARALARALGLEEDLTEAVALAHDLGHPPFGHAGERALDAAMRAFGGFDHNRQCLRIVGMLERRYPAFDGLNLTYEVLEGLAKHNGPTGGPIADWPGPEPAPEPALYPTAEAQVAAIADDIAYDAHDIDDGLRSGLLTLDGLEAIEAIRTINDDIRREHSGLEPQRLVHEMVRRLITVLVEDVIAETRRRVAATGAASSQEVRRAGQAVVAFSAAGAALDRQLKAHLTKNVYRHPRVTEAMGEGAAIVTRLFGRYLADASALPPEWRGAGADEGEGERARRIADFLSGQTDGYAVAEAARLFDGAGKSR